MTELELLGSFASHKQITKGWSDDKKYCVIKDDGTKYLLRIIPAARYNGREPLFAMLSQVAALGIPMCLPLDFGTWKGGVFSLQSWIEGADLEDALPKLSTAESYELGLESGEIARKIHSLPAPKTQEEWASRFNSKIDRTIAAYEKSGLHFEGDRRIIDYIQQNRHLLNNRPQSFQHGDYHIGNMMLEKGRLVIIDFDRCDFGDPWEEFNRIVWSAQACPHFATGQLNGYFGAKPPLEFFQLLALYISNNTLVSFPWSIQFGQSEIDTMTKQSQDILSWYDNMKNPIPTWYIS